MDFERFLDLLKALTHEGVDYVLVGGVALRPIDRADATALRDKFRLGGG